MRLEETVGMYIESEKENQPESTIVNYTYRLQPFLDFCNNAGIEKPNRVNKRLAKAYRRSRAKKDGGPVTYTQELRTFYDFISWCEEEGHIQFSPERPRYLRSAHLL